ncbi:MAG TPA: exosome complex RNA-binding protein Csl4 [Acidobacteriota bacterium]|jgi:exosome complex component CSL4|nr:exosome complex RNA-binding protein Csl4 [Acidobacteriota bacterium]
MSSNRSSEHVERKKNPFVLPGERLGVIEEFVPDAGTYVKDGVIHAGAIGQVSFDIVNKRVSVRPLVYEALVPKVGTTVLGQVTSAQPENASIRIFKLGDKSISGIFSGVLHISDVQPSYVESMFDVCKPNDIIRAQVISEKNQVYHLSTKDKNLGVVYAFCSNCGNALESKRQSMHCPRCGKIEKRKIALDYGKVML